jgi:hypothetical protein
LYDFLIPYRKYTVDALEQALQRYLFEFCSYAEALWSQGEQETGMAVSTLFRAMAAMTEHAWLAKQQLQAWLLDCGLEFSTSECENPNAVKAKSPEKALRLEALTKVVRLCQPLSSISPIAFLQQLFLTRTEHLFSFLTTRLRLRLSGTHSLQRALF